MKQDKFMVTIPIIKDDGSLSTETEKKYFPTIESVCKYLEVTPNTVYALRTKRLKLKHSSKKHLEGINIEKIPVYYTSKKNNEEIENNRNTFLKNLRTKI